MWSEIETRSLAPKNWHKLKSKHAHLSALERRHELRHELRIRALLHFEGDEHASVQQARDGRKVRFGEAARGECGGTDADTACRRN